ncbi:MAG: 3-deoxy-8-phosphooctulonate synthase [Verrucomicrobia bacterium]|jgi:2-dehydro-3-deoxyphosphooctonate aldolase (KDO 8-P synthase)|nr:3-deoxy-8-phosphooctulonate synthase [Verrucomicrobiota bacterium]
MVKRFEIQGVEFGGGRPVYILGPCVIESEQFVRSIAEELKKICDSLRVSWIFKASYDKANRTSVKSFRGPGLDNGCRLLRRIGDELEVPVTTDVHSPDDARAAAQFVDLLQIPAFLCRQTDLIQAAAETGRAINVKKGQFLAPWDVRNIADKLETFGCSAYVFTERGTSFGYHNLVADMRSLYWIRELGFPVIFDATHSVQRPSGAGDRSGGDGILAPVLAKAAAAAGCDGIFIETHSDPRQALSDGPNQIPLRDLYALLEKLKQIHEISR